ncbi:hypothetical protein ABVK25_011959 [Lepraria finkii]|uniref:Uncharacterized protein n=1 Tax=Lepraria finkii TaxID=1340010 RepID=A0ABR4AJG5_9LECA
MRFKASIRNLCTFARLTASLSSLGKDVWLQLNNELLRFTVVPEQGSQVWAVLAIVSLPSRPPRRVYIDRPYGIRSSRPTQSNQQLRTIP